MVVAVRRGHAEATAAGCALLLAHAVFKAALFMVVGIIDHQTGTRDIRDLPRPGPGRAGGWVGGRSVVGAASMAGVPLAFGFVAKEAGVRGVRPRRRSPAPALVLAGIVAGSVLTVAYSAPLRLGRLRRRRAPTPAPSAPPPAPVEPPPPWRLVGAGRRARRR